MYKPTITFLAGVSFFTSMLLSILPCKKCYANDDADVSIRELATQAKRKQNLKELMEARPVPGNAETIKREPIIVQGPIELFMKDMQERILHKWRPVKGHELDYTVLTFKIGETGAVKDIKVPKPSATPTVDEAAVEAVKNAAPFPKASVLKDYSENHYARFQFTLPPPFEKDSGTNARRF
ncbi:MAG: energy transducer TonB [Candidatus Obscuribacterales bacterium]|nr:energy transducer TonB [Candidatus Obscuribacterales bacterium]